MEGAGLETERRPAMLEASGGRGQGSQGAVRPIGAEALVALLEAGLERVVLIDSRPFVDYNSSHILEAVSVNCSKLMKRRLQQDKVHIQELLQHSARKKLQEHQEVVVYDQSSSDPATVGADSFLGVLLLKLGRSFPSVHLLSGGFSRFSSLFPGLCEGKSPPPPPGPSQPGPPMTTSGPTRILPHLYLGCQRDVLDQELMRQNAIGFVLNASHTCPQPPFIADAHFLRVPVNDSFCEKILPWLDRSLDFIEKAKASNSRVLVHCLAGISRSATIAIAYIMKRMDLSLDEAYRFVKEKRPTISPNFNFLGQLLDFEKKIKTPSSAPLQAGAEGPARPEETGPAAGGRGQLEPLTLPCVLADGGEEPRLALALGGLQLSDSSARLKRSFSLDIKSFGESVGMASQGAGPGDKEGGGGGKACQFSPVEEVSEQSSPETPPPRPPPCPSAAGGGGATAGFLLGLSSSQQHLAGAGPGAWPGGALLKGWHSDVLLAGGWYLDSALFYSTSAILGGGGSGVAACGRGPEAVQRRRWRGGRPSGSGDSRRSWHEESSFEKQLKRRSCHMELGEGRRDGEERANQDGFSGSMELIQVS